MNSKIVTADEAVALIQDGNTLCCNGFVQSGYPDALLEALERRFLETGSPRNLTLFAAAGLKKLFDRRDEGGDKQ